MSEFCGRVLIVDDDEELAGLIEQYIVSDYSAVRVDKVHSAEAGIKRFSADKYDLVMLDYNLPGMDGIKALSEFKRMGRNTPVIMMTGVGKETLAVEAMKKGAYDYIPKGENFVAFMRASIWRAVKERQVGRELGDICSAVNNSIGSLFDLNDLLPMVLNLASVMLNSDSGSIMIFDARKEELEVMAVVGRKAGKIEGKKIKVGESIGGRNAGGRRGAQTYHGWSIRLP
ncbi:response regulator [Elusimicrobiota bacterium]